MKKTLSILLVLTMLFAAATLSAQAVTTDGGDTAIPQSPYGDSSLYQREPLDLAGTGVLSDSGVTGGCKWTLYGSTLTISKDTGTHMENYDDGEVPPYFKYADDITSIVIAGGVTDIGNNAFCQMNKVVSLSLPNGLKVIGRYAFSGCTALSDAVIPNSVTKLGTGAFYTTGIESLTLSSNLTVIPDYCFASCPKLTSVSVPNSVTAIGDYAFCNDTEDPDNAPDYALETVWLSDNLVSLGVSAFEGCNHLWRITLPDSLTTMGERAFYGCAALQSVAFSKNLTMIPNSTFMNCTSLTYADIPGSVKTIDEKAFYQCTALHNVHLSDGIEKVLDYAFYDTPMKAVTIPPSVIQIQTHSFAQTHPEKYQYTYGDYLIETTREVGESGYRVYGAPGSAAQAYANRLYISFNDAKYHLVFFTANGGSGTMDAIHVSEYENFTLPACTMTPPTGKVFSHWTVGPSGTRYNAGASYQVAGGVEFCAQWTTPSTTTTVSSVYINGWPEAVAGQSAADNPPAGTITNRNYQLTSRAWYTVERVTGQPARYVRFNGTFVAGNDYVAIYTVKPNQNVVFANPTTVDFADGSSESCVPQRGGYIETHISVRAAAVQTYYVSSVTLTLTAPTAGEKPDYSVKKSRTACDFYTTGLGFLVPNGTGLEFIDHSKGVPNNSPLTEVGYYMTADETFKAGGTYTARIFLSTADHENTYFDKTFSAIVNGMRARVGDTSGGRETITWVECTFTVKGGSSGELLGDVDSDGKVDIFDASSIQKSIAGTLGYVKYATLAKNDIRFIVADIDKNGVVDIFDASLIQKWIAGNQSAQSYGIGVEV